MSQIRGDLFPHSEGLRRETSLSETVQGETLKSSAQCDVTRWIGRGFACALFSTPGLLQSKRTHLLFLLVLSTEERFWIPCRTFSHPV